MVLEKSDTKDQFLMDDIQSKRTSTTSVDMPQEINECYSEFVEGSGETIDSQETISEPEVYSNVLDNQKLENDAVEKRSDFSANFQGETDILNLDIFIFRNPANLSLQLQITVTVKVMVEIKTVNLRSIKLVERRLI